MAVYQDRTGREWHVDINVASLRRVRDSELSVDLLDITDESKGLAARLFDDPVLLVGVLFEVCRPEAERLGTTPTEFGEAFDGEAIDKATTALLESLANFIPRHRGRAMAQAAVQGMTLLDNLDLVNGLDEALTERGLQSFSLQESSESTPAA
jgi:hypothetical protein